MVVYVFCLRVAPYIPNWTVNITAPILNVPLFHFFVGTFFGMFFKKKIIFKRICHSYAYISVFVIKKSILNHLLILSFFKKGKCEYYYIIKYLFKYICIICFCFFCCFNYFLCPHFNYLCLGIECNIVVHGLWYVF